MVRSYHLQNRLYAACGTELLTSLEYESTLIFRLYNRADDGSRTTKPLGIYEKYICHTYIK